MHAGNMIHSCKTSIYKARGMQKSYVAVAALSNINIVMLAHSHPCMPIILFFTPCMWQPSAINTNLCGESLFVEMSSSGITISIEVT